MTEKPVNGRVETTTGQNEFRVTKDEATPEAIGAALEQEAKLAQEADAIRGEAVELTPALFLKLYRLLCRPIPPALITRISATKGKPYESTGLRSVQVQVDRMNAVLTPLWWSEQVEYLQDGRLAEVAVRVGMPGQAPLVERSSRGGVERGSTTGNVYKGSYTNAAKLAFARLGVGHEVYVGAADLDPDTHAEAAEAQGRGEPVPAVQTVTGERVAKLRDQFDAAGIDVKRFQTKLGALGVTGAQSVNVALASLTPGQADDLEQWMGAEADREAAKA